MRQKVISLPTSQAYSHPHQPSIVGIKMVSMWEPKSRDKSEASHSRRHTRCCQISQKVKGFDLYRSMKETSSVWRWDIFMGKQKACKFGVPWDDVNNSQFFHLFNNSAQSCIIICQALNHALENQRKFIILIFLKLFILHLLRVQANKCITVGGSLVSLISFYTL